MLDEEGNSIRYFSGPVHCPVDILDLPWSRKLFGFYAKLLHDTGVDEVFSCSRVKERFLDGSFGSGMQQEGNMDAFLSSNIHGIW
jgi:hypothetical protein